MANPLKEALTALADAFANRPALFWVLVIAIAWHWPSAAAFGQGATMPSAPIVQLHGEGEDGRISEYIDRFIDYRMAKTKVEVRGGCYSACTLVLAYVEAANLCVGSGAFMAFDAARSGDPRLDQETWLKMPAPVRKWIDANGGYEKLPVQGFWTMYDRDLWAMGYSRCEENNTGFLFNDRMIEEMILSAPLPDVLRFHNDRGGKINIWWKIGTKLAAAATEVEIYGKCYSACTLITAQIPKERLCFGSEASLQFHKASTSRDDPTPHLQATQWMIARYPQNIQNWIAAKGGITKMPNGNNFWTLDANELWAMGYRKCGGVVPTQYRGLWCEAREGTYYRCREATSEGYQHIHRDRIKLSEEGDCHIAAVTPTTKGHRLRVYCPPGVLPDSFSRSPASSRVTTGLIRRSK